MNWKSKKLVAFVVGLVLLIIKALWPDMADLNTTELVALIGSYVVGQGIADNGKEKAKIEMAQK